MIEWVYAWVAAVLPKAIDLLGVEIDPVPLGSGANGQVFATTDGRVVKITANHEEIRALQILRERLAPDIDRIVHLGPTSRPPDFRGDPAEGYAILREAITPLTDPFHPGWEDSPTYKRAAVVKGVRDRGGRLEDYRKAKDRLALVAFTWEARHDEAQTVARWMSTTAGVAGWHRRGGQPKKVEQALIENHAWAALAPRGSIAAQLGTIGQAAGGAFADFERNLGTTADGRVVVFDAAFVDGNDETLRKGLAAFGGGT
jgi:hypothetical protein